MRITLFELSELCKSAGKDLILTPIYADHTLVLEGVLKKHIEAVVDPAL
jgi:hypothetical protein